MNWELKRRDWAGMKGKLRERGKEIEGGGGGSEVEERVGEGGGRGIELACPPSEGCKEPLVLD
jgi:hypothetical protein